MAKEKKEKQAKQLVVESREELYDKAVAKLKADSLIVQFAYKIENYRLAAAMFEEVGDYLDAPQLKEKCLRLAAQTQKEEQKYRYQRAVREMDSDEEKNWSKLAEEFKSLGDYHDAKERYARCHQTSVRTDRGRKIRAGVIVGILAAIALGVVWVFVSGANLYVLGTAYRYAGLYDKAEASFEEAGDLLDAPMRAKECARKQILTAKKGEDLTYGSYRWKVLSRDADAKVLTVIATSVGTDHDFYLVSFDEDGTAGSWEESSLRAWLNGPVLENGFSTDEKECLICQTTAADSNPDYPERTADETQDYLRILSASEAEEHFHVIKNLGNDCWLRTPGQDPSTFCFITGQHRIRTYGMPSQTQLTVRPVIQIDYSGME